MRRFFLSYPFLHASNASLNMLFSFAQLVTFAHVLPNDVYSKVVVLTAVSFFTRPLDQAIGRANFLALREGTVLGAHTEPRLEVAAFLLAQAALLAVVASLFPLWLEGGAHHYVQDAFYLAFALLMNFWSFDLQTTAWSLELQTEFAGASLALRVLCSLSLAALWVTHNFLLYAATSAAWMALSAIAVARMFKRRSPVLFPSIRSGGVTRAKLAAHSRLVGTSLLASLSELVVLNLPYALISAVYGVGQTVVTFDSIMKVGRLAMNGSRTLAEIALPRHSRMTVERDQGRSTRLFLAVLAVSLAATAVPAAALAVGGRFVFSLLLGHNNVLPPAAGLVGGVIVLITGLYQPVLFFVGFANSNRAIQRLTVASAFGFAVLAAIVLALKPDAVSMLWGYAVFFGAASLFATILLGGVGGYLPSLGMLKPKLP